MTQLHSALPLAALLACLGFPSCGAPEQGTSQRLPALAQTPLPDSAGAPEEGLSQAELERLAAEISPQVAAIRGLEFKRPVQVKVADKESVAAYARERMDAMDSPAERQAAERLAKLLGLLPVEVDLESLLIDFLNEQAGGFYDPGRDTFYLLEGISADLARSIISHEFVHALEDQHYDLGEILESRREDSDRASAAHAVLEGSALSVQNAWMAKHMTMAQMLAVAKQAQEQSADLFAAPLAVWKPMLCSYYQGLAFLQQKEKPSEALMLPLNVGFINAVMAQLPRSTEQVLHPDKYWSKRQVDEPRQVEYVFKPATALETRSGEKVEFELLYQDVQGEAAVALLFDRDRQRSEKELAANLAGVEFTNSVASGWDGDRVALFKTAAGQHCVHWTSVWDTPEEAEEFERAGRALLPDFEAAALAMGGQEPRARLSRAGFQVTLTLATSPSAEPLRWEELLEVRVGEEAPVE
jgi:hypothetical protein